MQPEKIYGEFPKLWTADENPEQDPASLAKHRLNELITSLKCFTKFKEGDVIKWKHGLKNRLYPEYGQPAVVTKISAEALFDPSENSASSPFFREPLTIIIAIIEDGDLLEYHVDERRFEPYD